MVFCFVLSKEYVIMTENWLLISKEVKGFLFTGLFKRLKILMHSDFLRTPSFCSVMIITAERNAHWCWIRFLIQYSENGVLFIYLRSYMATSLIECSRQLTTIYKTQWKIKIPLSPETSKTFLSSTSSLDQCLGEETRLCSIPELFILT